MQIAIDGPAGAGKSTIAKILSKRLSIIYLDTGAMYRAVGLKALNLGLDTQNKDLIETIMDDIDIKIKYDNETQYIFLDGIDVSSDIRENEVSMAASDVSKWKKVRLSLVDMQRDIASRDSVVMDGRDIGTYVLPDADYKFYITADVKTRALRRQIQLCEKGIVRNIETIENEIETRDAQDMNREFAPLKQAEDAIFIDTSDLSIQEVVEVALGRIGAKKYQ